MLRQPRSSLAGVQQALGPSDFDVQVQDHRCGRTAYLATATITPLIARKVARHQIGEGDLPGSLLFGLRGLQCHKWLRN